MLKEDYCTSLPKVALSKSEVRILFGCLALIEAAGILLDLLIPDPNNTTIFYGLAIFFSSCLCTGKNEMTRKSLKFQLVLAPILVGIVVGIQILFLYQISVNMMYYGWGLVAFFSLYGIILFLHSSVLCKGTAPCDENPPNVPVKEGQITE